MRLKKMYFVMETAQEYSFYIFFYNQGQNLPRAMLARSRKIQCLQKVMQKNFLNWARFGLNYQAPNLKTRKVFEIMFLFKNLITLDYPVPFRFNHPDPVDF
jgi:hypothetical protein